MQAMAKLHTYYVSNASSEMSYAYSDLTDDEFYKAVSESFNDIVEFSDDEIQEQEEELNMIDGDDGDDNLAIDNKETLKYGRVSNGKLF